MAPSMASICTSLQHSHHAILCQKHGLRSKVAIHPTVRAQGNEIELGPRLTLSGTSEEGAGASGFFTGGLAVAATFVSTDDSRPPLQIGLLNPNGHLPPKRHQAATLATPAHSMWTTNPNLKKCTKSSQAASDNRQLTKRNSEPLTVRVGLSSAP
jgi:hypothetical protein